MDDSAIKGDEVIDVEAKLCEEETKTAQTNFNERKQIGKHRISVFYLHFY